MGLDSHTHVQVHEDEIERRPMLMNDGGRTAPQGHSTAARFFFSQRLPPNCLLCPHRSPLARSSRTDTWANVAMVCLRSKPRAAVRPPRERRQGRPKNICACGQTCSVTGAQAWARLQRLERLGGGIVELDLMRGETVQAVSLAAVTACAEIALLPDLLGDGGGWLVIAVVLLSLPLCNSQVTSSSMTTPRHPSSCTGRRSSARACATARWAS